jgi:hypothetical protein
MDFDRAKAVGGPVCELSRLEITAEGEGDVLSVGVELARGRASLAEAHQGVKRVLGNGQDLAHFAGARLAQRDIDPEEAPGLAQLCDAVPPDAVEPFDDLCHRPPRLRRRQDGFTPYRAGAVERRQ